MGGVGLLYYNITERDSGYKLSYLGVIYYIIRLLIFLCLGNMAH